MGTEVKYKNSFTRYYSMRNANEDPNNSSWHLFNTFTNGHYCDGFTPRPVTDAYIGQDKGELKQKILQHEAIFKNQVHELHRLYRRQRDMMEEVKRKELHKYHISIDTSSSSSLIPCQDANRWQNPSFSLGNSTSRPSIFGADISNSPLSCSKGNGSKDCELVECRPSKVRKKLFDLQLPAKEYIEPEEAEHIADNQISEISSYPVKENGFVTKNGANSFLDDGGRKDGYKKTASNQHFIRSNALADLNEPVYGQDIDFLGTSAKPCEGRSNGRDRLSSCAREPGNDRSTMNHTSQLFETSKLQIPCVTMQHLHGKEVQHQGIYSEIPSKIQDRSHFNQIPLLFSPPSACPFASTSDMGNSWGSPWERSHDSSTHKLTFFQTHLSSLPSHKSHEVFRDKWHRNGNGFYNGSSSGSKELFARVHSVGNHQNGHKLDGLSQKISKGSSFVDLTGTTKDMDLNSVQNLSNEDDNSRSCDQTVLPWLKAKPVIYKNGDHSGDVAKKKDDSLGANKKLLGFPIFGNFGISKNDNLSGVLTSASIERREIDINVAWDDDNMNKQVDAKKDAEIKNQFDLNSCVTEDDNLLVSESFKSSKKKTMEIDLEAPAVSEIDEEDERKEIELNPDHSENKELEKFAAEAIVAISSQQDHAGPVSKAANDNDDDNPLLWFVDVINSCEKNTGSTTREIDEYEMLTLQLEETKEEDYMPMPLVSDFEEPDEAGPDLTSCRPRRGQARRGRPRRDFQRDILPGMTSLLRHEITEDLQIFGGLMKATGHSWNLGSTRRNGKRHGARGRRKVKVMETTPASPPPPVKLSPPSKQVNSVEVLGLDERSLTGWGKTTRRPRRQRCAAGNSVAVQFSDHCAK